MKSIIVTNNEANQRLDKLLIKYLNKAPKSFIYKMLRKKNITLNGKKAEGSEKISIGDEIKLFLSDETILSFAESKVQTVSYDLNIIYEDSNIILINKPAGILSQKANKEDISVVEHLISYLIDSNYLSLEDLKVFKPSICNRLDRNTSGLMVAGKSLIGLQVMNQMFKERTVQKYYKCIVKGKVLEKKLVKSYLLKDEKTNKVEIFNNPIKDSVYIETEYEPITIKNNITLLRVKLITGKSHQIRAHLSKIGHPILGDFKYGDPKINSYLKNNFEINYQLLHSHTLVMPDISGELSYLSKMTFEAKLPDYYQNILDNYSL